MGDLFSQEVLQETWDIVINDMPLALWETFYVTVLATLFAVIIGLPLGVLLVCLWSAKRTEFCLCRSLLWDF